MDYCFVVPDPLGTARQPQTRQFMFPPPHGFDSRNGSASHDSISAQQTTNSLDLPHTLSLSYNDLAPVPQDTQIPSVSDAELTATATDPTLKRRKKKAPTLRAKAWERYKARIIELHDTQNLPLSKVKEMIEKEFGFVAELRQYRTRITQWGKDKNIKPAEMTAIVRKRQQRRLIEVDKREQTFSVRGREVEPHKIDRWMVRHEVSQTSLYAPSPAASTPSAVSCRTISECDSVASSPAHSTSSLSFSPRRVVSRNSNPLISSPSIFVPRLGYPQDSAFTTHTVSSVAFVYDRQGRSNEAEDLLRQALETSVQRLGENHPVTIYDRRSLAAVYKSQGRLEEAQDLGEQVSAAAQRVFGEQHPETLISMSLLIEIYEDRGQLAKAKELKEQKQELEKRKAVVSSEAPPIAY